ncbi:zinc-dependent metalloprotease [Pararcticibacter amylolyticus]|nr:zinc-dependent metalloprotease [Pararcticibacter amylolyticus]
MNSISAWLLAAFLLVTGAAAGQTGKENKKEQAGLKKDTAQKKKETAYQKLFKGKKVETSRGMITLHKMDGKVYFEFPKRLFKKPMLLGSVAEAVSNPEDSFAGLQAHDPLCIYFTQIDSVIYIRKTDFSARTSEQETALQNALAKNNTGAMLASFKIQAVSPDSSAVVFDVTPFFVNGNEEMDPFMPAGGFMSSKASYKSESSLAGGIMAFKDNISVTSYLSYGVTSSFMGFIVEENRPATIIMKRSLMLLPDMPARPRLNDPRIGVFYTNYTKFAGRDKGSKEIFFANRWRLEPKDPAAFKRGELVEPVKPVVFYIDDKFPDNWISWIRQGTEDWNMAFEKIGFKNAVVTKMYPKDDPEFDPNNIRYNCIKYAPTLTQNAMGPSWVDPRTGEILNASVYLYHGVTDLLSNWMFIQTAAVDERVRTTNMPPELMGKALRYVIAHEIGHCLGLMHNMGASSSFPVDSLRSPSFTQKYGTTPSIMDYARFNFVAQPGDLERGVKLTPPDLGVYDYYVIKWLYSPLYSASTPEEEVPVLDKWVSEKIKDPMFRYGKQQISVLDPNSQTEDLGDDQVKATEYAMSNLKYILKNMNGWLADKDTDYSFRKDANFSVINIQFYWYMMHVLNNVGGIYQYEKYEGDPFPAYRSVPKETQRRSVLFLLSLFENLDWLNAPETEQNIDAINGDAAEFMRGVLFPYMMRWVANIGLSENKADADPYTRTECVADVFDFVWGTSLEGKAPSKEKLSMQNAMVQLLIRNSGVLEIPGGNASAFAAPAEGDDLRLLQLQHAAWKNSFAGLEGLPFYGTTGRPDLSASSAGDTEGFGFMPRVLFQTDDISHVYYGWLLETKDILEKAVAKQQGDTRAKYQYFLLQINRALKSS